MKKVHLLIHIATGKHHHTAAFVKKVAYTWKNAKYELEWFRLISLALSRQKRFCSYFV